MHLGFKILYFQIHSILIPISSTRYHIQEEAKNDRTPRAKGAPLETGFRRNLWKWVAAASITFMIVTAYLGYQRSNSILRRFNKINHEIEVLSNPAFQHVSLKGTANAPDAMATVYWNKDTKEVYLDTENMKELSQDNQYQLWAIIDGKPVDAGVFDGGPMKGLLKMKDIGDGVTKFVVTIELRGGKASPTLETMQVAREVKRKRREREGIGH